MLIEKRINYAIGIAFYILVLGVLATPYITGSYCYDSSCYGFLNNFRANIFLNDATPLLLANYSLIILTIIFACILMALAVVGIVLRSTKYKQSKAENIISLIYSWMVLVFVATIIILIIVSFAWIIKSGFDVPFSMVLLFIITAIFPYFCATKFNSIHLVFMIFGVTFIGLLVLLMHKKHFKPRYEDAMYLQDQNYFDK